MANKLNAKHKAMVDYIIKNDSTDIAAYRHVFRKRGETTVSMTQVCSRIMNRPEVKEYKALLERTVAKEFAQHKVDKAVAEVVWNREKATALLLEDIKIVKEEQEARIKAAEEFEKDRKEGKLPSAMKHKVLPRTTMTINMVKQGAIDRLNDIHGISKPDAMAFAVPVIFEDESKLED